MHVDESAVDRRPHWELLPFLYAVIVAATAWVTLGAGVLLAFVSLPTSLIHLRWPGVSRASVAFWLGVAMNGLLFAAAVLLAIDL
jgi:hypothetical protein